MDSERPSSLFRENPAPPTAESRADGRRRAQATRRRRGTAQSRGPLRAHLTANEATNATETSASTSQCLEPLIRPAEFSFDRKTVGLSSRGDTPPGGGEVGEEREE